MGGNTRREFLSGPLKISREMLSGMRTVVGLEEFALFPTAIKSYFMYEIDCVEPSLVEGGREPGKRCENGYAWLPIMKDAVEVRTSHRARVVFRRQQSLHEFTDEDGIQKVFEYLMV